MEYYLRHDVPKIGHVLGQFPCMDYYTLDKGDTIYYDTLDKFKCLLPKRKNLIVQNHNYPITVPFIKTDHPYHHTAGWLPRLPKYESNFLRKRENFYYPKIELDDELLLKMKQKFKFNKPMIAFVKITADPNRNWNEEGWNDLIEELSKDFVCIDVGSKNKEASINSCPYVYTKNLLNVGDDYNFFEIAHILSLCSFYISPNTGIFILATAVNCPTLVLQKDNDHQWFFPNTFVVEAKDKPNQKVIEEVLSKMPIYSGFYKGHWIN